MGDATASDELDPRSGAPTGAVAITRAPPARLEVLAGVLGRAFHADPMIQWPIDDRGTPESIAAMFGILYEAPIREGMLWEAGDAAGVAVWVPPGGAGRLMDADRAARRRFGALVPDGGIRYQRLWDWIETKIPEDPVWYLDVIGVDPPWQGAGVGAALVRHGLALADADGVASFLETSRPGNVGYYERLGFRVVQEGDAPGGGPRIWFMRRDA